MIRSKAHSSTGKICPKSYPGITAPVKRTGRVWRCVSGCSPALLKVFIGMDDDAEVEVEVEEDVKTRK